MPFPSSCEQVGRDWPQRFDESGDRAADIASCRAQQVVLKLYSPIFFPPKKERRAAVRIDGTCFHRPIETVMSLPLPFQAVPAPMLISFRFRSAQTVTVLAVTQLIGSSAAFWPILSLLNDAFGWRLTFLICAALQFFICLPLHLFALPRPIATQLDGGAADIAPVPLSKAAQRKAFLLIAASTTITTFITFGISPSLLEIFRQSGASPAFALQLGSSRGILGISARFLDMLLGRRGNPILSAAMGISLMLTSLSN